MTSGRRKGKLVTSAAKRLITRMPIKPYDTEKANPVTPLASPLGEEGHEVAKGWTVVILIMILDVDVTAEGGIIKLIARKGNPQPYEPSEPFSSQPFYTTRGGAATTTFSAAGAVAP